VDGGCEAHVIPRQSISKKFECTVPVARARSVRRPTTDIPPLIPDRPPAPQPGRPTKVLALFLLGAWLVANVLPRLPTLRRQLWLTLFVGSAIGLIANFVYARIKAETGSTFLVSEQGLVQTVAYNIGTTPLRVCSRTRVRVEIGAVSTEVAVVCAVGPHGAQRLPPADNRPARAVLRLRPGPRGSRAVRYIPLVALTIIAGQQRLCVWWLTRFAQGPLEWVWRQLTYSVRRTTSGSAVT
jgi:uncharacterized protein